MYKKISDYGVIGNLHSIALVGLDGSIDWLCLPHIDSPSVFGALLDHEKGGRFAVTPLGDWDSVAEYVPDTNILVTRFRTRTGILHLTDFMPIPSGGEEERHELYRLLEVTRGEVEIGVVFEPRFDYARTGTLLERRERAIIARINENLLTLSSTRDLHLSDEKAEGQWRLSRGERIGLHLKYGIEEPEMFDPERMEKDLSETKDYWQNWLKKSETGRTILFGPYENMINRSALVLKLLYYNPIGTIAAAATTSLPEKIGGMRNWDYRYTWVRDTSFTLQALFNLGHLSETEGYLGWIKKLIGEHGPEKLQIMYGLRGEEDLTEMELPHLEGYKGSRPVRIGNSAARQIQLDIYGEIMDAALKLSDYVGKIDFELWPFLCDICNYVVEHWQDKDYGIWEIRGGPYPFVYSKVMCWVALDRGITIAHRYGFPGDLKIWEETKEKIKKEVLEKGWNETKQSFVQHYDTDALDSSNLLIPLVGFLPIDDPRVISTLRAIQKELSQHGFLYRYHVEDGLPGSEGTFLLCTFWLIHCLIAMGELDEAETLLRQMERTANHLGLYSEEYDVGWREALGNFPQAFTHIGYINSVIALIQAKEKVKEAKPSRKEKGESFLGVLFGKKRVLNDGDPQMELPAHEIIFKLKTSMNLLRGAFFNTAQGRVAYERMRDSEIYQEYVRLSYNLKHLNLKDLKTREEQISFWINLYNVLVIHGVIELGIKDSVKEATNFFRRIQYQVDDLFFTPHDIEHGILRENHHPPYSLFRLFNRDDPRSSLMIQPMDPRIHFALVCASSSCPPIDIYTPEHLDQELTISGKTFLNAGGIQIDRDKNRVSLSKVFKWYRDDFGNTKADLLRFIAPYLYKPEDREHLHEHAERIKIDYQDYDWRLNRYRL